MRRYWDEKYKFFEIFNPLTGALLRSDTIVDGRESGAPASMRSFPELLDVGVMGHCHAAKKEFCSRFGVDCYQNGHTAKGENLHLDKYRMILEQCRGDVFQIVLGGAGDPVQHEHFGEMLKLTRSAGIVPNLTTTGFELTQYQSGLIGEYCGAVAVSLYSRLDSALNESNDIPIRAISMLNKAQCVVNIHYVLSRDTIDDAVLRLRKGIFPEGISAVIFLLYKPIGEGRQEKVIDALDNRYLELLKLVEKGGHNFNIGFDTCQTPAIRKYCPTISYESIELCEAARFSMYIDSKFKAYPCSFACGDDSFDLNLNNISIVDAWNSVQFEKFRNTQISTCHACGDKSCRGCAVSGGVMVCGNNNSMC